MPYRRIPSLNWLRVFEAAARKQSFSGAAQILNMSPAAVSQQIKALETHLKAQLFERGPRTVTLTDSGASFLPVVRQSLASMETTAASLFGHEGASSVTIQATLIFATSWLAPRLPAFARAHPDIELHLMGGYRDTDIDREGPDLYIVYGGTARSWGHSDPLFGETIYPVATPEIAATIDAPTDLLEHRIIEISTHRASWSQLLEILGLPGLAAARSCFADTSEIALEMAAAGYGIALARAPATDRRVEGHGLVRCLDGPDLQGDEAYHLIYRSPAALSPAARRFRDWLLEETAAQR